MSMKFCIIGLLFLLSVPTRAEDEKSQNETTSRGPVTTVASLIPEEILQMSSRDDLPEHIILVDKSKRLLEVFKRKDGEFTKVVEYPTDIGKNGGAKTKRNDQRTPEGIYFLTKKLTQPEIPFQNYGSQAFTTDYPNYFDHRDDRTGDGIWLHAIPDNVPLTRGSRGCVVVRNDVIKLLESYIQLELTPIVIKDKINYVSNDDHKKMKTHMSQLLDTWKQAWESQDMEKYLSYYHDEFTAPGFKSLARWLKHKRSLKERYKYVKVTLSDALILKHKNQYIVKARQDYESDQHRDTGLKTLYFIEDQNGKAKIIREEWKELKPQAVSSAIVNR